jgi:hypothetical protein
LLSSLLSSPTVTKRESTVKAEAQTVSLKSISKNFWRHFENQNQAAQQLGFDYLLTIAE